MSGERIAGNRLNAFKKEFERIERSFKEGGKRFSINQVFSNNEINKEDNKEDKK
jgi:hypothetical protein